MNKHLTPAKDCEYYVRVFVPCGLFVQFRRFARPNSKLRVKNFQS